MDKQKKQREGPCVYCGEFGPITRDHVVPKSLFTEPYPDNMITVSACDNCNSRLALHQDYLRDLLIMDYRCEKHPVAAKLRQEEARRAIISNRSDFATALRSSKQRVRMFTPSGLYVGNWLAVPLEDERISLVIRTMITGLFCYH